MGQPSSWYPLYSQFCFVCCLVVPPLSFFPGTDYDLACNTVFLQENPPIIIPLPRFIDFLIAPDLFAPPCRLYSKGQRGVSTSVCVSCISFFPFLRCFSGVPHFTSINWRHAQTFLSSHSTPCFFAHNFFHILCVSRHVPTPKCSPRSSQIVVKNRSVVGLFGALCPSKIPHGTWAALLPYPFFLDFDPFFGKPPPFPSCPPLQWGQAAFVPSDLPLKASNWTWFFRCQNLCRSYAQFPLSPFPFCFETPIPPHFLIRSFPCFKGFCFCLLVSTTEHHPSPPEQNKLFDFVTFFPPRVSPDAGNWNFPSENRCPHPPPNKMSSRCRLDFSYSSFSLFLLGSLSPPPLLSLQW